METFKSLINNPKILLMLTVVIFSPFLQQARAQTCDPCKAERDAVYAAKKAVESADKTLKEKKEDYDDGYLALTIAMGTMGGLEIALANALKTKIPWVITAASIALAAAAATVLRLSFRLETLQARLSDAEIYYKNSLKAYQAAVYLLNKCMEKDPD